MEIKLVKAKPKLNKKLVKWLPKLVMLVFVFYAVFMLVNQFSKISIVLKAVSS